MVSVSQANFNIVAMTQVMPVAGRLWNFFPVLDSHGYAYVDVFEDGPSFLDYLIFLYGHFNVDLNFMLDRHLTLSEHLDFYWHVDHNFFLYFFGVINLNVDHDNTRFVISLRHFVNEGHIFGNHFEILLWFFECKRYLDEFW